MTTPRQLDHAGIAARVPHAGRMCLLHALIGWDDTTVHCQAIGLDAPDHPLRDPEGLSAATAIEYAAQAMALHAGLRAPAGTAPRPGFLASARGVRLHVPWLHDAQTPVAVRAECVAGDDRQAQYRFTLHDACDRLLADGRATVVLNTPLTAPEETAR